jgi:hypothetical protein
MSEEEQRRLLTNLQNLQAVLGVLDRCTNDQQDWRSAWFRDVWSARSSCENAIKALEQLLWPERSTT